MKIFVRLVVGALLSTAFIAATAAQDKDKVPTGSTPPKLLVIQREWVKPGKGGAAHEKTESAFVQAMSRAKWPTHYLAVQSLTGKPRVLFLTNYDSFEAWEKDVQAESKNAVLSTALDRANETDGTLLDGSDQAAFVFSAELSLHPLSDLSHTRYLEIFAVHVKPGHAKEWEDLSALYKAAADKAIPGAHWATFQAAFGAPNGTYLYLTARKSAGELDRGPMEQKALFEALGADGMKKLNDMFGECVESSESQLLSFNPAMSYPPEELVKADGDFWRPKQATMSAEKKTP